MMTGSRTSPHHRLTAFLLISLTLLISGCLDSYGRIQKDTSVTDMFTQGNLPADHRYYTIGRENQPWAVIGIDPGYQLLTTYWKEVPAESDLLAQRIKDVWSEPNSNLDHPPHGGRILSPDGARIGLWYSSFNVTDVRMEGDAGVHMHSPRDASSLKGGL